MDHNKLVRMGTFDSGRPLLTRIDALLLNSALVQFVRSRLGWPKATEDGVRLTAKIIEASRNAFRQGFHSDRFYVLLYPGATGPLKQRLLPYLKAAGIQYFDYSQIPEPAMADRLPHDSHPSARSYHAVATRLAHDLGLTAAAGPETAEN
jgi:hypothetical protein